MSDLTRHDRMLIEKSEAAIPDGIALERWCRRGGDSRDAFRLDVEGRFRLPNRAEGYFDTARLSGGETTVMGCRQYVEFGRVDRVPDAGRLLTAFILGEFLGRAHWLNKDGSPGGFDVERTLYRTIEGEYGRFPDDDRAGAMDWWEVGTRFRWVLLTIALNDFSLDLGPVTSHAREAVCVVALPEFVRVVQDPSPACALEVSIGYPFADHAPIPSIFGFGPGKFGIAVKLYSFFLMRDRRIRATMEFAAAPRARKVFDINGRDPVYGGADLLRTMTGGIFNPAKLHDRMDTAMLVAHCQVHQKLMDGTERVWRDWLADRA